MEPTFKKIDLDRSRGLCFYMAFCYLPTETIVLTGDLVRIRSHAYKNFPTIHAALVGYRGKQKTGCFFEIIGKKSNCLKDTDYYFLRHVSHKKGLFTRSEPSSHSGWSLYLKKDKELKLVKFYRHMPRQYLSFFSQLNT